MSIRQDKRADKVITQMQKEQTVTSNAKFNESVAKLRAAWQAEHGEPFAWYAESKERIFWKGVAPSAKLERDWQWTRSKEAMDKIDKSIWNVTALYTAPQPRPGMVEVPEEPTDTQEAAGGVVLWEKQFEGTPWKNKVKLIDPASMGEYNEVARHVYDAMLAAFPQYFTEEKDK